MSTKIEVCELWRRAGYGSGSENAWDDILVLERGTNGLFTLSFSRCPNDSYTLDDDRIVEPVMFYCSPEFREPARLVELLLGEPTAEMQRYETWPTFSLLNIVLMLADVMEMDVRFAREALNALAQRLREAEVTAPQKSAA